VLSQTDKLWMDHLQRLKFLQTSVGLRGYAQKDPLIEYKLEGYELFLEMMAQIRRNVIYSIYEFQPAKVVPVDNQSEESSSNEGKSVEVESRRSKSKVESKSVSKASVA